MSRLPPIFGVPIVTNWSPASSTGLEMVSTWAPAWIRTKDQLIWQARLAKNWAESDVLRGQLTQQGCSVKDGKDTYTL